MKNCKFITILTLVLVFCLAQNAKAQFNIRTTPATGVQSGVDTIKMTEEAQPSPLDLSVYSSAYDRYLKREIFKFRNKINLQSSFGINQASFDNWATGGNNSFSGRLWVKLIHTYTNDQEAFNVVSSFEGAYSLLITDDATRKSEDFLNIVSTPSWKLSERWEVSGSLTLKTQFSSSYIAPGDTILASSFFAPANLNISAGITYAPPKGKFKAYIAPLSGNGTFVLNQELADKGAFGVEKGKMSKTRFGALGRIEFNTKFFKDKASFYTKAESFWDYYNCPNLWMEARLTFQLTKIFAVELYAKTIYDEEIQTPRVEENNFWQFTQSSGFKLTYNFSSKANTTTFDKLLRR